MIRRILPFSTLLALALPGVGLAQAAGPASVVEDRELEYQAAMSEYLAAYDAWEVLDRRWNQMMEEQDEARRSGDDDRIERVLAEAQELSGTMTQAEARLRDMRDRWQASGRALMGALDAHLELLTEEAGRTPLGSQADLAATYRDRDNRLRQVEEEIGPSVNLELQPLPDVTIGPRDGPRDILFKARLLDRKADQHETLLSDLNSEIASLERRRRRGRMFSDFVAGLERFDDTQVPVTAENPRGRVPEDVTAAADSTATAPTLEQRIQSLETLRAAVSERRDQLRSRAEDFRSRAGEVS